MPVAPHPDCPAVVHGPVPYGRCICATRPVPTAPRPTTHLPL